MMMELIGAGVGTVAFAVLYAVPRKHYLPCGLIGLVGWLVYRLVAMLHAGMTLPVFAATFVVVFFSRLMAVRRQCPATVFLITGIFPLVPGAQIYWAAYYLVTGQLSDAMTSGLNAIKAIIAIVLGIIFVFEIPNRFFLLFRAREKKAA